VEENLEIISILGDLFQSFLNSSEKFRTVLLANIDSQLKKQVSRFI